MARVGFAFHSGIGPLALLVTEVASHVLIAAERYAYAAEFSSIAARVP